MPSRYDAKPESWPWTAGKDRRTQAAIVRASETHNLPIRLILSKSSEPHIVRARRDVMVELRNAGYSLPRIGRQLGGIHHSTIHYNLAQAAIAAQPKVDCEEWAWPG